MLALWVIFLAAVCLVGVVLAIRLLSRVAMEVSVVQGVVLRGNQAVVSGMVGFVIMPSSQVVICCVVIGLVLGAGVILVSGMVGLVARGVVCVRQAFVARGAMRLVGPLRVLVAVFVQAFLYVALVLVSLVWPVLAL